MKYTLLIFLFITCRSFAATVAHLSENEELKFRASNSSSTNFQEMVMDVSGGGGSASSDPHDVYVPFDQSAANGQDQDTHTTLADRSNMPLITPSGGGTMNVFFRVLLFATPTGGEVYTLQGAVKDDSGSYKKINITLSQSGLLTDQWQVTINLGTEVCAALSVQECDDLLTGSAGGREEVLNFYFFAKETIVATGDTVDPAGDQDGGVFYKILLSDKVPAGDITMSGITKGDSRLTLNFTGGNSVTNMNAGIVYKTLVYRFPGTTEDNNRNPVQTAGIANVFVFDVPVKEGNLDVKNLTNGTSYNFAVALVNKYQFANPLSNSIVESPLEIEALLKSQACYLVTAGFQRKHYVLDYFRQIRDDYLMRTFWGSALVDFYYETAPQYAATIYNSSLLSWMVRVISYSLYFFIKYFWFVLGGLVGIFLIRVRFQKLPPMAS